jgi:hypothetical protein
MCAGCLRCRFWGYATSSGCRPSWKTSEGLLDWNDLAVRLVESPLPPMYDIIVVDETQDFTASRVRAVLQHLEPRSSVTFVLDAAQRIYPHFFHWKEVGVDASPQNVCLLRANHRNTKQIAAFAKPLIDGITMGPDASLPDLTSCTRTGPPPVVLLDKYAAQVDRALDYFTTVDLTSDSAVFLHPKGGGYFHYLRRRLASAGVAVVELQANRDWPGGTVNVGRRDLIEGSGVRDRAQDPRDPRSRRPPACARGDRTPATRPDSTRCRG